VGLATSVAFGLAAAITNLVGKPADLDAANPADPVRCWRDDFSYGAVAGTVTGIAVGAAFGLPFGIFDWLTLGPAAALRSFFGLGISFGLFVGVVYGVLTPRTVATFAACVQLRRRGLPLRLMRFLEDARRRDLLRTVGPVYQFRHGRLQDHLAADYEASRHRNGTSRKEPSPGSSRPKQVAKTTTDREEITT
jgi:hypothetical protein